jgi:hypothetical protein
VILYKPLTGGPVRAQPRPYEFATDLWIGTSHFLHNQATSQSCTFTAQYFYPDPWTWKKWFHPKSQLLGCLCWELIRLSCQMRQAWIWTWVLTSPISGAPKLVPETFQFPLCNHNSPPQLTGQGASSPWINIVWWYLAGVAFPTGRRHWASDKEVKTPPSKSQAGPQKCYRRAHTETERAPKLSESKFIKWIWVQRPKAEPWKQKGLSLYTI